MFQRNDAWQSKNIKKAKKAAENITDPAQLMQIALSGVDRQVGEAAIQKITDRILLIEIASSSINIYNRLAALKKIDGDETLANIAILNNGNIVSDAVVERLSNPKLLAEIAQSVGNETCAKKALLKINEEEYVLPFTSDRRAAVYITAVEKMKQIKIKQAKQLENEWLAKAKCAADEQELAQVALSAYKNGQQAACVAAVESMTEKKAIAGIALKAASYTSRFSKGSCDSLMAMLKKIDDEKVFAKIAKEGYFDDVISFTLGSIKDNTLLADIAENGKVQKAKAEAISKLDHTAKTSMETLERIIRKDWDSYVRCHAVRFVSDKDFLREILEFEQDVNVKDKAKDRLAYLSGEGNICW